MKILFIYKSFFIFIFMIYPSWLNLLIFLIYLSYLLFSFAILIEILSFIFKFYWFLSIVIFSNLHSLFYFIFGIHFRQFLQIIFACAIILISWNWIDFQMKWSHLQIIPIPNYPWSYLQIVKKIVLLPALIFLFIIIQ